MFRTEELSRDATRESLETFLLTHARRPVPGNGLARRIGRLLPQQVRPIARRVVTDILAPFEFYHARRLRYMRPLRLNLGCGTLAMPAWVNIDLVGLPVDLAWNLSRPLPFPDNSVDAIFHEHVLEHLSASDGYALLRECHRVLRSGGVMRVVLPDASLYIRSYCEPSHGFLNSWRHINERGLPPLLGLQEEFYNFGHKTIYDFETLAFFCKAVGFAVIEARNFGNSRLQPVPDSEWRKTDSLYAEMVK
jgi:predicted SAM-dependent methyltransferase